MSGAARPAEPESGAAGALRPRLARLGELVVHLAHREVSSTYRRTLLGWSWPVIKQVAQLAVLVFVFSVALDFGYDDYALFVFTGLIAWSWFSAGISDASWSVIAHRYLVFRSGFPTAVLPVVAVATRFIDVLLALPVLAGMLVFYGELHLSALLFPALAALQFALMIGLGWIVAALTPRLRDIPALVTVCLLILFYLTPVFYDVARIPAEYRWVIDMNPVAALLGCYRDILMLGQLPDGGTVLLLSLLALVMGVAGWTLFRRLSPDFVDVL